ncbi:rhodanese-like domain-containing protein 11, chloroplastic [Pyrus communis]|uniref:rhodanese-like domain-containing protein 11, chloroplastic n=1 Tax=Pyrus communis TaxID=23211 RepID=UPI0035C1A663
MEALGFPSLNTLSILCSSSQKRKATKPPCQRTHFSSISPPSSLKLTPSYRSYHFQRSATRMQGDSEDYELKQMRDMAAAKKRWEALAWVKGSIWIPLIDVGQLGLPQKSAKLRSFGFYGTNGSQKSRLHCSGSVGPGGPGFAG